MKRSGTPSEHVAVQVKETLARERSSRRQVTGAAVRLAALAAVRGTRSVGRGASNLAREAVEGAVQAVGEVGGETRAFVKDAVIGVVEGTEQVVTVTSPAVREVVVGAIRGAGKSGDRVEQVGHQAVEGAIVGAASVGIDSVEAATAAVEGAVAAVVEVGGDLTDAAEATLGGVVSGVVTAGGDVASATHDAAYTLISHDAVSDRAPVEIADVAGVAIETAVQRSVEDDAIEAEEVITAAATGAVVAAYEVSQTHGDRVRRSVLLRVLEARISNAPEIEQQLEEIASKLSSELPKGRAAWRGTAMFRAARLLVHAGGIDLAASLAFFIILSILPMIALVIMAVSILGNPVAVGESIVEILVYYFPASEDLIREAVDNLLGFSLAVGLFALIGIVVGANGLFMAANRSVNRVYGLEAGRIVQITITQMSIAPLVVILLLLSVGITALFEIGISFSEGITQATFSISTAAVIALGIASTALPAVLTAVIFAVVYRRLPNVQVEWRDAAFGAIVAIVVFEIAKLLFFWFTNLSSQRHAVYGPAASVVILMMWSYLASLIFLYGAALSRMAGELRPDTA